MKIKADWKTYLHGLRRQEADLLFRNCDENTFENALEMGAGDGFMSSILASFTKQLLCTEINEERLHPVNLPNVRYMILDAEQAAEVLRGQTFDFIFTSNLLEHLPNVENALNGMHQLLADDGIAIHTLPNRIWKTATILFYIPNTIIKSIDKFLSGNLFKRRPGHKLGRPYKTKYGGNNPKIGRKRQSRLTKLFLPAVHGVSKNTCEEFYAFGKKIWIRRFIDAGFEVVAVKKLIFSSGYGFGFKNIKALLERLGIKSVSAFIICKQGHKSKYEKLWIDQSMDPA